MFQHILVPLDGSACAERALPVAAQIARATHGTLVLARALPVPIEAGWNVIGSAPLMEEALDRAVDEAEHYLARVAQSPIVAGLETNTKLLTSTPVTSILAATRSLHADLIVMCSRGATGITHWMTGSVTQEVVRHSPVPVLALRDGCEQRTGSYPDVSRPLHSFTTVVALDGSHLAEEALVPAATLTAALAAPARGGLHLTRVVKLPTTGKQHSMESGTREQALYEAKRYLREVTEQLFEGPVANLDLTLTWSVAMGEDVAQTLIRVAEHGEDARGVRVFGGYDMLAMVTHGRSGLPRWMLGSVTEQALTTTRLPLFIVHTSEAGVQPHAQASSTAENQTQTWVGLL